MKKHILLISLISVILLKLNIWDVKAVSRPKHFESYLEICDAYGENCTDISSLNLDSEINNDLFKYSDKTIYLNNSTINVTFSMEEIKDIFTFNITGTNKIKVINGNKKFIVEGTGTLEIESRLTQKINKNVENYYECWKYNPPYEPSYDEKYYDYCLLPYEDTEEENIVRTIPAEGGLSVTDIKEKIINNPESLLFGIANETTYNFGEATKPVANSFPRSSVEMHYILSTNGYESSVICEGDFWHDSSCISAWIDEVVENGWLVPDRMVYEKKQLTRDWAEEHIQTELARSFTETGSYLIGTKQEEPINDLDTVTTTQTNNIIFESPKEFDSNYHLSVVDKTESITEEQSNNILAKTDKTLIKLYDINMLDQDNKVIPMEDGTYTIKIMLSDLLKKYNNYQVIYISEDNKVELIDARVEDNYIVFNTTHLSRYGIVGREITTKGTIITNPQTADSVLTYVLMLVSLAVAISLVIFRINKLKKAN